MPQGMLLYDMDLTTSTESFLDSHNGHLYELLLRWKITPLPFAEVRCHQCSERRGTRGTRGLRAAVARTGT